MQRIFFILKTDIDIFCYFMLYSYYEVKIVFGKKNRELKEAIKQRNFQEFGTTNKTEIQEILKTLKDRNYKTRCNNLNLVMHHFSVKGHLHAVNRILKRYYIIPRERKILNISRTDYTPTEKFLIKLDNAILDKQLMEKKYSDDERKTIINNIRTNYFATRCDLLSNNIDDYTIDNDLNVTLLSAKDRYKNAIKQNAEEKIL